MFHFLFRAIGMVVLAAALVAAVLDLTRSIAASKLFVTPFGTIWQSFAPGSFEATREKIVGFTHPVVWDPLLVTFLSLPGWLVLWLLAMILLYIGQKKESPYRRFASR